MELEVGLERRFRSDNPWQDDHLVARDENRISDGPFLAGGRPLDRGEHLDLLEELFDEDRLGRIEIDLQIRKYPDIECLLQKPGHDPAFHPHLNDHRIFEM